MRKFKVKLKNKEYIVEVEEVDEFTLDDEQEVDDTTRDTGEEKTELKAPLSGLLKEIFIEEGKLIKQGQEIIFLEAMKMEHKIKAPVTGVVAEIKVRPGENVEPGQVLVVFE